MKIFQWRWTSEEGVAFQSGDMNTLEMLAILRAVLQWGPLMAHRTVRLYCDNDPCVGVIRKQKASSWSLLWLLEKLATVLTCYDIHLYGIPIGSTDNYSVRCRCDYSLQANTVRSTEHGATPV